MNLKFFEVLRKSTALQGVIGILPALLILLFSILLLNDLSNVYTVAYKNAEIIKDDKSVIEVQEYSKDESNIWVIKDINGTEIKAKDVNISVVLNDDEDAIYYSKDGSLLLTSVGRKYYNKMLIEDNILPVLICWCFICTILVYCVFRKDFTILSRMVTLVINLGIGIALVAIVIGGYIVF